MITCPWCGTNYAEFQSNCGKCGGSLPIPPQPGVAREEPLLAPPPAPRPIADRFAWKPVFSDGGSSPGWFCHPRHFPRVGEFVFGGCNHPCWFPCPADLPSWLEARHLLRYQSLYRPRLAGRAGCARKIVSVEQNYNVRVNQRHPGRSFTASGHRAVIKVRFHLNTLDSAIQAGNAVYVLYLPDAPKTMPFTRTPEF
jgi:hypothetical protein